MNNTNKPSILFDIDLTLFDADLFRLNVYPRLAEEVNISLPEFNETLASYTNALEKSSDFLPNRFLRHIAKAHSFPFQQLYDTYFHPQNFKEALYPDTMPALQELFPGRSLGIYSEGYRDFQTTKLRFSGILDYFDPDLIYIHRRKIDPDFLRTLPEKTTIIDDRIKVLESLSQISNLSLVWLNRKDTATHPSIRTILLLTDLYQ
jgi:FMN phosphatase YigB (HAD superfamily)